MTENRDHQAPTSGGPPPPLSEPEPAPRPSPGEEARTLVARASRSTLATVGVDPAGYPFGSVAPYGLLDDGRPVLCVSRLAEHTRNLEADPRCSLLAVDAGDGPGDPLALGRVTLVADARRVTDDDGAATARAAYLARNPDAALYIDYGDFGLWALEIAAVRWVGGFGRMSWCSPADYAAAEADPTWPVAAGALAHLNADHADALVAIARACCGYGDATAARATRLVRYGIELELDSPRGTAWGRAPFEEPLADADGLRAATVSLTRRARTLLADA
jgi:putative heme iron utilization protein